MTDRIDQPHPQGPPPLSADTAVRLDRLFRRYNQRLVALAVTRTRDRHAAEDVASETWLRVAAWLPTLQADDDHAYGWLAAITRRAAADHYRPRRADERPTDFDAPGAPLSAS
ncbi:sigma-70 family RNA polymerase sigma factor, partial [Streptomyces klenkii]